MAYSYTELAHLNIFSKFAPKEHCLGRATSTSVSGVVILPRVPAAISNKQLHSHWCYSLAESSTQQHRHSQKPQAASRLRDSNSLPPRTEAIQQASGHLSPQPSKTRQEDRAEDRGAQAWCRPRHQMENLAAGRLEPTNTRNSATSPSEYSPGAQESIPPVARHRQAWRRAAPIKAPPTAPMAILMASGPAQAQSEAGGKLPE